MNHPSVRTGGIDLVFDFVAVISEAEIALAQLGEMRGEIEVVADFPVGAAFRFECMFCYIEVIEESAAAGSRTQLVEAGETVHTGIAGEDAVVVGKVVADRQHG